MSLTLLILTAIYGSLANNDVYHHTYNSVQINGKYCLGDCVDDVCVYNWSGNMATCYTSDVISSVYKTIKGTNCYSNCGRYDEEDYLWCATLDDDSLDWEYCTINEARTATKRIQTQNELYTCKDECSSRGSDYNWCKTHNSWEKCDPKHWVLVFDYPTEKNDVCVTRCVPYSGKYYCYNTKYKWVKCYLNPDKSLILSEFRNSIFNALQTYGKFFKNGYMVCVDSASKKKRSLNPQWPFITSVTDLVKELELRFPTITPNDGGSVQSFTVLPILNPGKDDTILPLAIKAVITRAHLRVVVPEGNISSVITKNYERQNPYQGRADGNNDDQVHLLSPNLGGPMEPWNFIPQPKRFNEGLSSRWNLLENMITRFLISRARRYVDWRTALSYDVYSDRPNRPISISMTVRMYEADGTLNLTSGTYENMFYSNDPFWTCRWFFSGGE